MTTATATRRRKATRRERPIQPATMTCEVCGITAPEKRHPCRFAKACRCWYGEPCQPKAP